jgi:hypothetical protein
MNRIRSRILAMTLSLFLLLSGADGAELGAQLGAMTQHNAYAPQGRRLDSAMVTNELERRMRLNPANEAALWNAGYDFYRNYPQNQDTAQAIKDGFLRARPDNVQQRQILTKAAIYWEKIHGYGQGNVPVAVNNQDTGRVYYGRNSKFSTLSMRPGGSQHKGFPNYDWPGRFIGRRPPYQGRPDNPYPGKYYPGVYPP